MKPFSQLKRVMLIYNPVSGRRLSQHYLSDIIKILSEKDHAVTVFPTGKQGDATEFARLYSREFDLVVCVGGDGTLNETITGLIKSGSGTPLGYVPSGSTNDFAACHGISSDPLTAALNIATGSPKSIDIGQFGDKYFSYVAAFGAFSWLSYTTPQNLKNVLGHSAYILDAVKDLPKVKAHHLRFDVGSYVCEGDYIFGAVCNSTSVAGTITLPDNVVDTGDGQFEVLLVHEPQTLIDFQNLLLGVLTQDYSSPFLDFFQTDHITVTAPKALDWSLDGERGEGSDSIEILNLTGKLNLIC